MTSPHAASADSDSIDTGIELSHVTRRFGRTRAVDDLSLIVPRGSTCGFVGLNGAGKTTAIRMMVGLLAPTAGVLRIGGFTIPKERAKFKCKIGYVPDRCNVYGWMTVGQAIDFCRSMYGPKWDVTAVASLMRILRLDPYKKVKHLSKGAAAKLSLLLAIGHNPRVLILDEPTGGFDPLAHDEFLEGILAADISTNQNSDAPRRTVLFSSHTLADVQRLADSVALLHRGKLLFHRPLEELLESTKRLRVVVDEKTTGTVAPPGTIRDTRRGREWTVTVKDFTVDQVEFLKAKNSVRQVDVMDLTLDDVFRDYVRAAEPIGAGESRGLELEAVI